MILDALARLEDAPAIVLSCPGPLRRHRSALMPLADAALPQVLLGGESQLLAFAAAAPALRGRLFLAPLPEMFADSASLCRAIVAAGGEPPEDGARRIVHLRFGAIRAARVLKGAQNCCVIAEAAGAAPLTASHHPFASGAMLPAAIRRLYVYGPDNLRAQAIGGIDLPVIRLPAACITADLPRRRRGEEGPDAGLELISLADFRSLAWAAGPVRPRGARQALAGRNRNAVLLPWNMDHPGSIVPTLLERLAQLHDPALPEPALPRIVLMPFNYIGQTGIIRRLIARLRAAAPDPAALLQHLFLARLGAITAAASLRAVSRVAWVDGNDPEHWWTSARLAACGIGSILIDPASAGAEASLPCDEAIWVEAETRCGALTFPARLPSLRALPGLLEMTAARRGRPRLKPSRKRADPAQALAADAP